MKPIGKQSSIDSIEIELPSNDMNFSKKMIVLHLYEKL